MDRLSSLSCSGPGFRLALNSYLTLVGRIGTEMRAYVLQASHTETRVSAYRHRLIDAHVVHLLLNRGGRGLARACSFFSWELT